MATKTIVCPECQALAVPGRYACAQCGALLASVALSKRSNAGLGREVGPDVVAAEMPAAVPGLNGVASLPTLAPEPVDDPPIAPRPQRPLEAPAWTQSLAAEPLEFSAGAEERWDDEPLTGDVNGVDVAVDAPVDLLPPAAQTIAPATVADILSQVAPTRAAARRVAAIAEVKPAPPPKTRRRSVPDPAALARIAPLTEPVPVADPVSAADPLAPAEALSAAEPEPIAEPQPAAMLPPAAPAARPEPAVISPAAPAARPEPAVISPAAPAARPEPAILSPAAPPAPTPRLDPPAWPEPAPAPGPAAAPVPAWPPPGDRGPLVETAARVPAGVYLPPSAVLPPGESLPLAGSANGRPADAHPASAAPSPGGTPERTSPADRLAQLDLPADTPRRVVAIGAVIAALGFLLPWTASPVGNDVLGDYWIRWGMAGPGAWIVVVLLLGLAGLTLAGGRLAEVPVGVPGVAAAMLLLGLAWPDLFGFAGHGVGIWVVLAAIVLLAIGGLLDLRAPRHDGPPPGV